LVGVLVLSPTAAATIVVMEATVAIEVDGLAVPVAPLWLSSTTQLVPPSL
jgi:hypothetical protein